MSQFYTQGPEGLDFSFLDFGQNRSRSGRRRLSPAGIGQPGGPLPNAFFEASRAERQAAQANQPPALITQMGLAGFNDASRMQGAADRQFGRNQAEIDGLSSFLDREAPEFERLALEQRDSMLSEADRIQQFGQGSLEAFDAFRDKSLKDLNKGLNAGYSKAAEATSGFSQAIDQFKDTSAQDASITAAGIRESLQQDMNMINKGVTPDGRVMSPAERMQAKQQLSEATTRSVAQAVVPMFQRANEALLSARNQLASLKQFEASARMQGEAVKAGTATAFSGQRVQLEQQAMQMQELAANTRIAAASLESAAHMQSVQFEAQNRALRASLTASNPESVVSLMPVLSAIMAAGTAPGASRVRGFSEQELGSINTPQSQGANSNLDAMGRPRRTMQTRRQTFERYGF